MANTVLQSLGRLNQYLSTEVAYKKEEDKRKLVNQASVGVANIFKNLNEDASPSEVTSAIFRATAQAGEQNILPETIGLINTLGQQSMGVSQYNKKEKQVTEFGEFLSEYSPYDLGNLDSSLVPGAIQTLTGMEKTVTQQIGGETKTIVYGAPKGGKRKVIEEYTIGPSAKRLAEIQHKNEMEEITYRAMLSNTGKSKSSTTTTKANEGINFNNLVKAKNTNDDTIKNISSKIATYFGKKNTDLKDIPGGTESYVNKLITDANFMATEAKTAGVSTDMTAIAWADVNHISQHGIETPGAAVPKDPRVHPLFLALEIATAKRKLLTDQISEQTFAPKPLSNSKRTNEFVQNATIKDYEMQIQKALADESDTNHSYFAAFLKEINGSPDVPYSEQWTNLGQREKDWVTSQVINEAIRQMKKRGK